MMNNPIRFHNPGSQFGKRCEKCGGKIKGHMWIDVDPKGKDHPLFRE